MNVGLHHGVISEAHRKAMGKSIWLYLWLVGRQTKANGLVLGGSPITYQRILSELGTPLRTTQRWLKLLQEKNYIEVTYTNYHQLRIRILKAKKFAFKQLPLPLLESAKSGGIVPPKVADSAAKSGGVNKSVTLKCIKAKPNTEPVRELVGFEVFWNAYPNQVGKPAALNAWMRFVRADDRWPEVLAGIVRWQASGRWDEARYIPNPEKFLSENRWEDNPQKRDNIYGTSKGFNRSPAAVAPDANRKWKQPTILSTVQ